MKKTILFALLINLGVATMSNANTPENGLISTQPQIDYEQLKYGNDRFAIGEINVSVTETITLKPDTATFSITYITEGDTPNDASNRNANNIKKLNDYLMELGINQDNLTTIGYQNYENEKEQPIDNAAKRFSSTFTIHLNIDNEHFFDVVKVLDEHQISDIKLDDSHQFYVFNIQEINESANQAKQRNQQKYQQIVKQLKQLGINEISVAGYDNQMVSSENELVKKYYVQNTQLIKVNNFEQLGKIITKAQELKMMVNNDFNYSVSEKEKNRILEQYEQTMYDKLAAKATRLLGQHYQLGVPTSLASNQDNHFYSVQPRDYGYSRTMVNAGQSQMFEAQAVDIQSPSEFTITLTMSGIFEIVMNIYQ